MAAFMLVACIITTFNITFLVGIKEKLYEYMKINI